MTRVCFSSTELIVFFIINIGIIIYLATQSVKVHQIKLWQNHNGFNSEGIKTKPVITKERVPVRSDPIEIVNYPKELNDPYRGPERNRVNHFNYTNVGFITAPNGDKYTLFGRQKAYRSNQYEYYISDIDNSTIKYPVKYKNYHEIYDQDTVNVPEVGGDSSATIYDLPELRYNPNHL